MINQLWQATLGRSAIDPSRRHPVFVYADEYQEYLKLPTDLADALAQARGLGVGFILAHQYMTQLDPAMNSAVLANAQSRFAFRLPNKDARSDCCRKLPRTRGLPESRRLPVLLSSLSLMERSSRGAARVRFYQIEPRSNPGTVRAASRERYGVEREEVEADIRRLMHGSRTTSTDDIGPRRRNLGGAS